MIYRLTLAAIAAVFFGIAAQSATAAISAGERPLAQEMEHGIAQPSYGGGTSTPPSSDTTEPEAVESVPAPVEQGISTSPGVAPVDQPDPPAYEANEKPDEEPEDEGGDDVTSCEANVESLANAVANLVNRAYLVFELGASSEAPKLDGDALAVEETWDNAVHYCNGGGETAE